MNPFSFRTKSCRRAVCCGYARGFTLIEIITVLILVGILSAVAIVRIADTSTDARAATDTLKAHLRHAHGRAMNSDISWGIHSNGNGYVLFYDGDVANNTALLPGEQTVTVAPRGVTLPSFTVSFDSWGRPYDVADPAGNQPITEDKVINVGPSYSITITSETGFIP